MGRAFCLPRTSPVDQARSGDAGADERAGLRDRQAVHLLVRAHDQSARHSWSGRSGLRGSALGRRRVGRCAHRTYAASRGPAGTRDHDVAKRPECARLAACRRRPRSVWRCPHRDPPRSPYERGNPDSGREPPGDRIAACRHPRPDPREGGGESVLRRGGHPDAHRSRGDPSRREPLGGERYCGECGDPGHPAGPVARTHRPTSGGEQAHVTRGVGHRPPVRREHPRATPRGSAPMTTKTELGTLEASGLIQIAAVQPELEYLFRHALVQDAAYSSLLKQDRRALHQLAAESLLTVYPERQRELAAVIAMHFDQAGDLVHAAEQYAIAGEHALERFAQREAVNFFKRAIELLPPDDPRIDLRMRAALGAAKAGWTFSGLSGAIDLLESATEMAGDRVDRRLLADAYFWIAFMRRVSGESPASSPKLKHAIEQAEQIGEALGDPAAHAIPKAFMGAGLMFTGELRQGAQLLSEALTALEG